MLVVQHRAIRRPDTREAGWGGGGSAAGPNSPVLAVHSHVHTAPLTPAPTALCWGCLLRSCSARGEEGMEGEADAGQSQETRQKGQNRRNNVWEPGRVDVRTRKGNKKQSQYWMTKRRHPDWACWGKMCLWVKIKRILSDPKTHLWELFLKASIICQEHSEDNPLKITPLVFSSPIRSLSGQWPPGVSVTSATQVQAQETGSSRFHPCPPPSHPMLSFVLQKWVLASSFHLPYRKWTFSTLGNGPAAAITYTLLGCFCCTTWGHLPGSGVGPTY